MIAQVLPTTPNSEQTFVAVNQQRARLRITHATDSLDALGFVLQLGAAVNLPGWVRIPPDQKH